MNIYNIKINSLNGDPDLLKQLKGKTTLIVNVASFCGATPQYEALQKIHETFPKFSVLGVPCNQFGQQEPGTPQEIQQFCETNYKTTFPMTEKIDVKGSLQHELYKNLTTHPDLNAYQGDIRWNFEKFLINPLGEIVGRWATATLPNSSAITTKIESYTRQ